VPRPGMDQGGGTAVTPVLAEFAADLLHAVGQSERINMIGSRPLMLMLVASLVQLGCGSGDDGPDACNLFAPSCSAGHACLAAADGSGGQCLPSCDPSSVAACGAGAACEAVVGGGFACFEPTALEGAIFDGATGTPIQGAHILAAEDTGIVVTPVAISDAAGDYTLDVPVLRDGYGRPVNGTLTLRVSAADYQPYPAGIRPAIPIDAASAVHDAVKGKWVLMNASTDVALIELDPADQGWPSISGRVAGERAGGTLVVAECGVPPCPFGYADVDGVYVIHNVPDGLYEVRGFKAGLQLTPAPATVAGSNLVDVDLTTSASPLASVSGSITIVNAPGGSRTSVVLVPASTFDQITPSYVRGEVAPGLRAPEPGIAPNVSGAYVIAGVPEGTYKVLAAFENDLLIRDPDPGIAGTQIVEITVPDPTDGVNITVGSSFKITESLQVLSPGANGPEAVDPMQPVDLIFESDSSTPEYKVTVYDAFGIEVWSVTIPDSAGSGPETVAYMGPLDAGMYYQFRAVSLSNASEPRSTTEDLLGVFYVP